MKVAYFWLTLAVMLEQVLLRYRFTQVERHQVRCSGVEM